jgi:hypothetical protein
MLLFLFDFPQCKSAHGCGADRRAKSLNHGKSVGEKLNADAHVWIFKHQCHQHPGWQNSGSGSTAQGFTAI